MSRRAPGACTPPSGGPAGTLTRAAWRARRVSSSPGKVGPCIIEHGKLKIKNKNKKYDIMFQCPVLTWRCPLLAKCQPFQQMKLLWRSKMSCFRRLIKMKFSSGENSMVSRESSIEGQNDMKSQKEGWIFDISQTFY